MELAKIEALLEKYFEGTTSLKEEKMLQAYFCGNEVAPHLDVYKAMFTEFASARGECSDREVLLPKQSSIIKPWWYSVAALLIVAVTVGGFIFSQPSDLSSEEKEALAAFKESKEALKLMSQSFNEGAEDLVYIQQFTKSKNKILK
ncbi:hypothetical protein ACFQO1_12555 [Jejudonia soesokkakensis]|uniref:Uncharacterized protein n=1 Tax=Jejudonia soesokkakensis TaxID=1323432 RepID=A0ABW2MWE0_9FLAO